MATSNDANPANHGSLKAQATPTWTDEHVEGDVQDFVESTFASRYTAEPLLKNQMPPHGMPANIVYQLCTDLRTLDANPRLNLASFVTTWMEPEAEKLIMDSLNVNFVDAEEYPSSQEIMNRCVEMLAKLTHSPAPEGEAVGSATIGSSEAILLGALAMKKRWQLLPRIANRDKADMQKPNLVIGAEAHVCWDKFCRYFDVDQRKVPVAEGRYCATAELMETFIDENTIGVVAVLGSTYTGEFEDVEAMDAMLGEVNKRTGWDLVLHVDAASGGFIAPFLYPDLKWDFRLERLASINISGHKYGLVYPGLGWVIWRSAEYLPEEMIFWDNYLGTKERSITLNFSRGAFNIVAQYYQFMRLGFGGYRKIMTNLRTIADRLQAQLCKTGHFEILSKEVGVPLVAFRLNKVTVDGKCVDRSYDEYDLADRVRMNGWVIPAYTMPEDAEHVKLLRIVVREDLSMPMVDLLVQHLVLALKWLDSHFIVSRDKMTEQARQDLRENPPMKPC
ncbi:hypothetical protein N2152v2_006548 [Parachlorella kessleri]